MQCVIISDRILEEVILLKKLMQELILKNNERKIQKFNNIYGQYDLNRGIISYRERDN